MVLIRVTYYIFCRALKNKAFTVYFHLLIPVATKKRNWCFQRITEFGFICLQFLDKYSDSGDLLRSHQLSVYMKLLGSDFSNGVNFAIAKSMVRLGDMLGETTSCSSPDYEIWGWKSFHQFGPFGTTMKYFIYLQTLSRIIYSESLRMFSEFKL